MPQQNAYRSTPTNTTTSTARAATAAATDDLDDFLDEVDSILAEEETFAVQYRQRGGQ